MTAFCRWTVTLSTGASWGHFFGVQKALNTTELPRAHIDFLAEHRLLGGGAGKHNRKAGGFLESPSRPLQHKSIGGEWKKKHYLATEGSRVMPLSCTNWRMIFSLCSSIRQMSYLSLNCWEAQRVCGSDERWKTESSAISSSTRQERILLCTFTWLFHSLRLSECVPKHTIIAFCCLFRSKKIHIHVEDCWGARKINCSCGILYPPKPEESHFTHSATGIVFVWKLFHLSA